MSNLDRAKDAAPSSYTRGMPEAQQATIALTFATIALVEQQQIANRIALAAALIAAGQPQEAAAWLQELHAELKG